jgi:predicted amidophosphoribosyltransferase
MKCSRCAPENPPEDKFCPECGTRLRGDLASGSDRQAQIQNDDLRRALAEAAEQQAATAQALKVISASSNTARVPSTGPFVVSTLRGSHAREAI